MKKRGFLFGVICALAALPAGAQNNYHVQERIKAGGEGGWDYVVADSGSRRLFVSRSTHVMVFDTKKDVLIGDIPNTSGVHGIALAQDLGKGFTSNGRDSSVTVFDYKSLATLGVIKVTGRNPDAILYEPVTKRVFTFNGGSSDATVIDAASGSVLGTIPLGGKPEAANHDWKGNVFVNIEDKSEVVALDARGMKETNRWKVEGCEDPSGQGIDRAHSLLFLACSNKVMAIVSYANGSLVATVPIGAGTDGAYFDPGTSLAFSTNGGDSSLTVVHEDSPTKFTVVANVPTQRGARTIAVDEKTHEVYTVTAEFGPPPAPTPERPRPRPAMIPGTFTVLVLER
jgi:YVTN family beta-propeller protein